MLSSFIRSRAFPFNLIREKDWTSSAAFSIQAVYPLPGLILPVSPLAKSRHAGVRI